MPGSTASAGTSVSASEPLRETGQYPTMFLLPELAAGRLVDRGDDLGGDRLDLGIRQGLLARLQGDREGDRLLALAEAAAFEHVEDRDLGDQRLVGALGRLHQLLRRD